MPPYNFNGFTGMDLSNSSNPFSGLTKPYTSSTSNPYNVQDSISLGNSMDGLSKDSFRKSFIGRYGVDPGNDALDNMFNYNSNDTMKGMMAGMGSNSAKPEKSYLEKLLGEGTDQERLGALGTTNLGLNAAGLAMQAFMMPGMLDQQRESLKGQKLMNTAASNQIDMMNKQRANLGAA